MNLITKRGDVLPIQPGGYVNGLRLSSFEFGYNERRQVGPGRFDIWLDNTIYPRLTPSVFSHILQK